MPDTPERDVAMNNKDTEHYRKSHVFDPTHNGADECECVLTENADIHESDQAYEERMRPRIVNAPARIWLQVGCDDEVGEIDWKELSHSDVSWCEEKIHNTDIGYARVDPPAAPTRDAEVLVKQWIATLQDDSRVTDEDAEDLMFRIIAYANRAASAPLPLTLEPRRE